MATTAVNADMDINKQEEAIKSASAIWNTAFSNRDIPLFLSILSSDVQMASAGGKWQTQEGTKRFLEQLFKRRPDITWVNTSREININLAWNVAYESGDWVEDWTEPDGKAIINGRYFALWKQEKSSWYLHAIIFIPLNCSGPSKYCNKK